ncbi:MAG: hypothetical protein NTU60_00890 [Candidatus Aminicenantes bacterium]|nr:hypothetical protein [Candidatus Aminicenantes bacterium]
MTFSHRLVLFRKRVSRVVVVLAALYLAYGLVLSFGSHSGFPASMRTDSLMPFLVDKPVGEDAYYMLTIAWNLAGGRGAVYNFDKPTTGIQPLSTFLYAGLAMAIRASGGDKWLFIRSLLVLNALFLLVFAHLVGRIAAGILGSAAEAHRYAYVLGFSFAVFNFTLFRLFAYGLETGIYLILAAVCVRFTLVWSGTREPGLGRAAVFGLLAGLAILARIDFGVVLAVVVGLFLAKRRATFAWILAAGLTALAIASPWFLYVKSVSGHWMPSSGSAQAALVTAKTVGPRTISMTMFLIDHFTPWAYTGGKRGFVLIALFSLALFFLWVKRVKPLSAASFSSADTRTTLAIWAIGFAMLPFVYIVFFWPLHFYSRYAVPLVVVALPVMAAAAARRLAGGSRNLKACALVVLPACFFAAAAVSLHTGNIGNSMSIAAAFIQKEYPAPHKVGAFQSGVLGFFNSNVFNLDGKIDPQAFAFLKKGRIDAYIDREEIDVLLDWPGYISLYLSDDYLKQKWTSHSEPIFNDLILCYIRKEP